jgi:hypothetical protein
LHDRRVSPAHDPGLVDDREREEVGVLAGPGLGLAGDYAQDEVALVDGCGLGRVGEDLGHRGGEVRLQKALAAAGEVVLVAQKLTEDVERLDDALMGPRDLVACQLVVQVRPGRGQVDVLEHVGQRPPLSRTDREPGHAGLGHRAGGLEHLVPRRRRLDPRLLEGADVVPPRGLVGRLEVDAVEGPVNGPEVRPDRVVVLLEIGGRLLADGGQCVLGDEIADEAGLRDERHVGRVATLDLRPEERPHVGGLLVARLGAGLFGEGVQDGLEILLLSAGPDGRDADLATAATASVSASTPASDLPAGTGAQHEDAHESDGGDPATPDHL